MVNNHNTMNTNFYLPNKIQIIKYESVGWIETNCNNILGITVRHFAGILHFDISPHCLLIISQLNDQRHIEYILKPSEINMILAFLLGNTCINFNSGKVLNIICLNTPVHLV